MDLTLVPTATLSPMLKTRPPQRVDDFSVLENGECIGRIIRHYEGPRRGKWTWQVQLDARVADRPSNGTAESLEQAKAALEAAVSS